MILVDEWLIADKEGVGIMNKLKIGIVGFGEYSQSYMDLWMNHPLIEKVVGAEFISSRREHVA